MAQVNDTKVNMPLLITLVLGRATCTIRLGPNSHWAFRRRIIPPTAFDSDSVLMEPLPDPERSASLEEPLMMKTAPSMGFSSHDQDATFHLIHTGSKSYLIVSSKICFALIQP